MDTYSGKFVLRLDVKTNERLVSEAERRRTSLNRLCRDILVHGLERNDVEEDPFRFLIPTILLLKGHFKKNLLGVAVFGSRVTGKATENSDFDVLVILADTVPLVRSLYRWWDESLEMFEGKVVNPHFVHLPASPEEAGGLWLEVAVASKILWEEKGLVTSFIDKLLLQMSSDKIRRHWSNGMPYWEKT